jgi:hypothetical protein
VAVRHRPRALAAGCLCAAGLVGCASQTGTAATTRRAQRTAIERYIGEVEPITGLADGELTDLPNTQAAQRAAIIRWRIGLMVLARAAGAPLPVDLQQAGRGEIAPSPDGS